MRFTGRIGHTAWIGVLLSVFATSFGSVAEVRAAETETVSEVGLGRGYRPWEHMWFGVRDIPNRQNAVVVGAGAALTVAGFALLDRPVMNFFQGKNKMGSFGKLGDDVLGTGIPGVAIAAGTLAFGLLSSREHEVEAGEAHLEALLATFVITTGLKHGVQRERPFSDNRLSFPSAHTSTTFTSAGSLMGMYGPKFGIPALALATYTGVARLAANSHHVSDVAFGATLGFVMGYTYTLHHKRGSNSGSPAYQVSFRPAYENRSNFGVNAELRF